MSKRILQILALAVCLGLLPAAAYAKGGKGGGPPTDKGKSSSARGSGENDRHHGDNDRDDHLTRHEANARRGPSSEPSGWDKGKKKGWGDCDVPPGQAKKRGCDEHGFSTRERAAHSHRTTTTSHAPVRSSTTRGMNTGSTTVTNRPATATTSRASRPGQTRTIILQRDATKGAVQK